MTAVEERPPQTVLRAEVVDDEQSIDSGPPDSVWPRLLGSVLITVALLMAWVLVFLEFLSPFQESRAQKSLYATLRSQLAQETAPFAEPIKPGAPVALIDIPQAGIHHLVIVEGTAPVQLVDGPGHLPNSSLPGQQGTSVVLGRALAFGGPFSDIPGLRPGDPITVTTQQGRFVYKVQDVRHTGDTTQLPTAAAPATLTLVTASGSGWLGGIAPSSAVYVDAVLSGTPKASVGSGVYPSGDELPMGQDHSFGTFAELVLSLQLLVGVLAAVAWARNRWSRPLAHLVGFPVVLASLWIVTDVASRLLPNLL
jgi:sortase A